MVHYIRMINGGYELDNPNVMFKLNDEVRYYFDNKTSSYNYYIRALNKDNYSVSVFVDSSRSVVPYPRNYRPNKLKRIN